MRRLLRTGLIVLALTVCTGANWKLVVATGGHFEIWSGKNLMRRVDGPAAFYPLRKPKVYERGYYFDTYGESVVVCPHHCSTLLRIE